MEKTKQLLKKNEAELFEVRAMLLDKDKDMEAIRLKAKQFEMDCDEITVKLSEAYKHITEYKRRLMWLAIIFGGTIALLIVTIIILLLK